MKTKRTSNILLRSTEQEKSVIAIKSKLFNRKTSDYLRHTALSHWEDVEDTKHFRSLLKMYSTGDEFEREYIVEVFFQYYRRNGFPYNILNDEQKENRLNRVIKSKNLLLEDDNLQSNHQGVDLANSFHPHMMSAHYAGGLNSPLNTYNSDEGLRDCINRWLEIGYVPNHAGMRRILKTRNKTKGVVTFKPSIAKYIYDTYVPENGKVLDFSAGYGGRLVGCIASNKNILYHGIDPLRKTGEGNMSIASFFTQQCDMFGNRTYNYRFRYDMGCSEEVMPEIEEKYDLSFSSPPYYNQEIYSTDSSQSSEKFDEYKKWLESFLYVVVDQSFRILKDNGKFIINVKNLKKYKIEDDLVKYCERDWVLDKTYKMRLANNEFNRGGTEMYHSEPIFVFSKK